MTSLPEFSELVGHPVEVLMAPGTAGPSSVVGNIYTVDPVNGDLVVLSFSDEKKPQTMRWIPRHAVKAVNVVDGEKTGCLPKNAELDQFLTGLFREERKIDQGDALKRKQALLAWLKRNHVEVRQDGDSLLIFNTLRVESPYTADDCHCDNAIVLRRVRGLIEKCPPPA